MKASEKVQQICDKHIENKCHDCPLKEPCAFHFNDTKESFLTRMNESAEKIDGK